MLLSGVALSCLAAVLGSFLQAAPASSTPVIVGFTGAVASIAEGGFGLNEGGALGTP